MPSGRIDHFTTFRIYGWCTCHIHIHTRTHTHSTPHQETQTTVRISEFKLVNGFVHHIYTLQCEFQLISLLYVHPMFPLRTMWNIQPSSFKRTAIVWYR